MTSQRYGQIHLNGQPYRIDIGSYKTRDIVDFAPRAQVPGTGAIYNELGLYQPLMMTDWSHGFGFTWHTDEAGYLNSVGRVDTRHAGIAMLFTQSTISDTDQNEKRNFTATKLGGVPQLWASMGTGIRYITDTVGTWTDLDPVNDVQVNQVWHNGKYIFALVDNDRPYYADSSTDTSVWTVTGADSDALDFAWITHHDGFVYAGKDSDSDGLHGNEVYYDDSIILADLHGTPASDPTVIYVGIDGWPTKGGFSFQGDLYVPKADGLFRINRDRTGATKVLDFSDQASADNFRSWAIFNGAVYFPIRDTIYRWNGVSLANVTPPRITDTFPYNTYGLFDHFVTVDRYLLMTAQTNTNAWNLDIICYDGAMWHRLATVVTGSVDPGVTGTAYAMYYDPLTDRLWVSYYTSAGAGSWVTAYIPFQARSPFPYADFPTSGTHSLITSRIDAGFRRVKKSTPSILVEGSNLTKDQQYLKLYYSLDGGSWMAWGAEDGVTNVIYTNGVNELTNPLGVDPSTIEYYHMQLRVDFVTTEAAQTPVLEGLTIRLLMRPDVAYGHSFSIVAAKESARGLAQDVRTSREIIDALHTARASTSPILFVDPYGQVHHGYISSLNEFAVEERGFEGAEMGVVANIEGRVVVNFVEVG